MKKTMWLLALSATFGFVSLGQAAILNATNTGKNGKFSIQFEDLNNNNLFDINELTGFSGFTSVFGDQIVSVLHVPEIAGFSVAGTVLGGNYSNIQWWSFEEEGSEDLRWDLSSAASNWTYSLTGLDDASTATVAAAVPLPAGLPMLAAGVGVLGFLRRRNRA